MRYQQPSRAMKTMKVATMNAYHAHQTTNLATQPSTIRADQQHLYGHHSPPLRLPRQPQQHAYHASNHHHPGQQVSELTNSCICSSEVSSENHPQDRPSYHDESLTCPRAESSRQDALLTEGLEVITLLGKFALKCHLFLCRLLRD